MTGSYKKYFFPLVAVTFILSCKSKNPDFKADLQSAVQIAPEGIECSDNEHQSLFQVMIAFNQQLRELGQTPPRLLISREQQLLEVRSLLEQRIRARSESRDFKMRNELAEKLADLFVLLDRDLRALDTDDYENQIARIDYKSKITPEYANLSQQVHQLLDQAQKLAHVLRLKCEHKAEIPQQETALFGLEPMQMSKGLRWVMATAYQGCDVLKLDPVNLRTESVQGIHKRSDWGREYADLNLIRQTHYYLKNRSYAAGCMDVSRKPLVYDFGGAPKMKSNQLDLFTNYNAGSALGIDCSAFASAGAATAGLLYVKNSVKRPIYSRWSTRDFVDPVSSGWTCYSKVRVGPDFNLQPGDLATVSASHMVGIDTLDQDPLGIESVGDLNGCDRLTSDNFHFTIIQSASTKGSMGINRFAAADYVKEAPELERLFLGYAKAACVAKFTNRILLPDVGNLVSIIRHAGTDDCKAKRIPLVNERCILTCGI